MLNVCLAVGFSFNNLSLCDVPVTSSSAVEVTWREPAGLKAENIPLSVKMAPLPTALNMVGRASFPSYQSTMPKHECLPLATLV